MHRPSQWSLWLGRSTTLFRALFRKRGCYLVLAAVQYDMVPGIVPVPDVQDKAVGEPYIDLKGAALGGTLRELGGNCVHKVLGTALGKPKGLLEGSSDSVLDLDVVTVASV